RTHRDCFSLIHSNPTPITDSPNRTHPTATPSHTHHGMPSSDRFVSTEIVTPVRIECSASAPTRTPPATVQRPIQMHFRLDQEGMARKNYATNRRRAG